MSGIFGYFDPDFNENLMNSFLHSIRNAEYCITDQIFNHPCLLGKLGISNSKVKESITIDEDDISIVCCGEIYNEGIDNFGIEILRLYKERKLHLIADFNGSFVAAIYDCKEEKITLVNDRYGLIKLFYYYDKDHFCFSPKMKPLLTICSDKSLRNDSIVDFFTFGYFLENKTIFKHIHQLPSGSILQFSKGDLKLIKYWDYEYAEDYDKRSKEELIEELGYLWQQAVERRIKVNEKILIPLSGGLDSRAILAAALKCTSKENIITFTFGNPGSLDFEIGKIVAKKAGVKNIELSVEKADFESQYSVSIKDIEGMIDATPYFAIAGYKNMKKYGDRIFSGTMIDVLLGRHILSSIFSKSSLNSNIMSQKNLDDANELIFNRQTLFGYKEVECLLNPNFIQREGLTSSFASTILEERTNLKLPNYFAIWDFSNRWNKYIYFAIFRHRNLFNYTTMLDSNLVDFLFTLSPASRLDQNLYLSMLLKKYPELFELPTTTNFGLKLGVHNKRVFVRKCNFIFKNKLNNISSRVFKRNVFQNKGKNYIDYDDLLRNDREYQNYVRNVISKVEKREYFSTDYIEEIWKLHMKGKKNYSMLFGLLVTFELFLQNFVDE